MDFKGSKFSFRFQYGIMNRYNTIIKNIKIDFILNKTENLKGRLYKY